MSTEKDRREFYRIDDKVPLHLTVMTDRQNAPDLDELEDEIPSSFQLVNQLQEIETEASVSLSSLQLSEPTIADYLRTLNKRLDLIGGYIAEQKFTESKNYETVSLSGNGFRVNTDKDFPVDAVVLVEMLLPNSRTGIHCYGKVVESEKADSHYSVAVTFETIRESDREAIIRHVIRQESKLIRQAKEQRADSN